jgi:hypothetical protein
MGKPKINAKLKELKKRILTIKFETFIKMIFCI